LTRYTPFEGATVTPFANIVRPLMLGQPTSETAIFEGEGFEFNIDCAAASVAVAFMEALSATVPKMHAKMAAGQGRLGRTGRDVCKLM
jgi:hypothetical protein